MNSSDRDNGVLSSNNLHCAPLERGDWTHHDSINIALRWSAGNWFVAIYGHWESLSQNLLSRAQFACLIFLSSRLIAPYKEWWVGDLVSRSLITRLILSSEEPVLLPDKIIPPRIMACSQVSLNILPRWGTEIRRITILLTSRSAGAQTRGGMVFY